MRKIIFTSCILLIATSVFAQASKSVFFELAGNGLCFSLNYDTRFKNSEKGFGYKLGAGIIPATGETIINPSSPTVWSIPIGVNHLAGNAPHYLETGLGLTLGIYSGESSWDFWGLETEKVEGTTLFLFPSVGYRYAKSGKAFQGRLFISPAISSEGAVMFGGLSFGYKF